MVPVPPIAHMIIYFGSVPVLLSALFLVIFGFRKLILEGLAKSGGAGFWAGLKALVHDPLRFGMLWQMVFMNFTVSFVGIFVAVKLDEIFRVWPARDERLILTGHWHTLSGIVATIILFYYADMVGLKGKVRQWFGWLVILGSDLALRGGDRLRGQAAVRLGSRPTAGGQLDDGPGRYRPDCRADDAGRADGLAAG